MLGLVKREHSKLMLSTLPESDRILLVNNQMTRWIRKRRSVGISDRLLPPVSLVLLGVGCKTTRALVEGKR